jgi:hypothetical protein
MKSNALLFLSLLFLPGLTFAQKGIIESFAPASPIVVDGVPDEWQTEWLIEPKGKFIYNVCNDADNLYVRIKISDDMTQRKIGLFGLSVLLNPKGKKYGKVGVKYPLPKDLDQLAKDAPQGKVSPEQVAELKKELIKDVEVLELVGLSKENIVSPRLGLMNGLQVFIKADARGDFVYEAKIPFKAFHIDKSAVKVLGVAFVTGKLVVKAQNPQSNSSAGGYPSQRYGGGGYNGRYMNSGGGYSSTPYSEWQSATSMSVGVNLK